jgi:hypothetical protein
VSFQSFRFTWRFVFIDYLTIGLCKLFLLSNPAKGRECNINTDCASILDTSCVRDYDGKLRCLCGNFLAPSNGQCSAKLKGLRHQCRRTDDCEDYMICRVNNGTKTTILNSLSKDNSKKEMLCLCDEESGYMENIYDKHCNGEESQSAQTFSQLYT